MLALKILFLPNAKSMTSEPLLVRDLGEHGLLDRLQRFCPVGVVGDDGAILASDRHKSLVVTTDVLVDGVHFSDRTTSAFDVGWRAAAANLSDLAAMGANPLGITVGLSLPGKTPVDWVEQLYNGLTACLDVYHTPLVGGDICRAREVSLAITALGEVAAQRAILRSQARSGDAIVVTGLHGLSRGGLEILQNLERGKNLTAASKKRLIQAHQRPKPRLDVLPYLAKIPSDIAIAGMDSSDGLADAIIQMCHYSGVGAEIKKTELQIFSGLIELAGLSTAEEWLLYGGEDFELVLSLPLDYARNLVNNLGSEAAIIGKITQNCEIVIVDNAKHQNYKTLKIDKRFKHF